MWTSIVLVAVAAAAIRAEEYCAISPQHQLCNPAGAPASACTNTISGDYKRTVTAEDQKVILDLHNKLRRDLANGNAGTMPKAANMEKFTWDAELAKIAQAQVNKCVYGHDCGDCRKDKNGCFNHVGQNIAGRYSSSLNNQSEWNDPIQAWYDEITDYDNANTNVESYSKVGTTGQTGHFTQIIWAETYKVGCGFIIYKDGATYKRLYSCNYGHAGNFDDAPIYLKGEPCSKCPSDTACEDSLCADDAGLSLNMDVERAASTCRPEVVAPTTPGPARVCKNDMQDSWCKKWKSQGKCTSDMYKAHMRKNCYQECGFCTDRDTTTTTTAEPARDCTNVSSDRSCAQWKAEGKCTDDWYKAWLKRSCYKACGHC